MNDFIQGYARAIANVIHLVQDAYQDSCAAPGETLALPHELVLAWTNMYGSLSWKDLVTAGVKEQDLVVFEVYQKQLGLGPRPVTSSTPRYTPPSINYGGDAHDA